MDEGRKRVLLIAASILAVRKLAQYDSGARVPATVSAIAVRGCDLIQLISNEAKKTWSPDETAAV